MEGNVNKEREKGNPIEEVHLATRRGNHSNMER